MLSPSLPPSLSFCCYGTHTHLFFLLTQSCPIALQLFHLLIGWFKRLYPVFDKDQALMLWVGWYFALYISVPVTLARHAHIAKQEFMASIQTEMLRFAALSEAGIKLLADYAARFGKPLWSPSSGPPAGQP